MSRVFFLVSVPLVVMRNYIVSAPSEQEAILAIGRAPMEWFTRSMHNEKLIGLYETFEGVPVKATSLADLGEDFDSGPDMGNVS